MRVSVTVILIAILCFVFAALMRENQNSHTQEIFTESYWRQQIEEVGGKAAYEKLNTAVVALDAVRQHRASHEFGGALYKTEGIKGFSVCDERFSYGCFHEFLGRAVASQGLNIVQSLSRQCFLLNGVQKTKSCLHGVGHGILASLGYGESDLLQALTVCEGLNSMEVSAPRYCWGGVFMEYNLRTALGEPESYRFYNPKRPLEPCDVLPGFQRSPCVFRLPQWWSVAAFSERSVEKMFVDMGVLCAREELSTSERFACASGIGNIAPLARPDPRLTVTLCDLAFSRTDLNVLCKARAAYRFNFDFSPDAASAVCETLAPENRPLCSVESVDYGTVSVFDQAEKQTISR